MLVSLKEILSIAEKGGFAVPAFNVYNMETVRGVIYAAEALNAPVIIQSYSRLFTNDDVEFLAPIIKAAAEKASVPVCFHLDHGAGFYEVTRAVKYGCTGVMIDASTLPFEENIATTKTVTDICNRMGIEVEGELGHIGVAANGDENASYTEVDEAVEFVKQTNVTALAIMVGTAHGRYKQTPRLAIERIREIKEATGVSLVLHGGSGVPDDQIVEAVKAGIRKINFGTDLCFSFLDKVREIDPKIYAIDLFMKEPIEAVKAFAESKIKLLGAENRA